MKDATDRHLNLLSWSLHGLGLAGSIVVFASAWFVVFWPIETKMDAQHASAEHWQSALVDATKLREEHAQMAVELAASKKRSADLATRIPDEPKEADFLAQVSDLAEKAGLQIQDYRPANVARRDTYSVMEVDILCEGDYSSVCAFIEGMSRLPRHSRLSQLELTASDNASRQKLKMTVELFFGVKPQTTNADKGDKK